MSVCLSGSLSDNFLFPSSTFPGRNRIRRPVELGSDRVVAPQGIIIVIKEALEWGVGVRGVSSLCIPLLFYPLLLTSSLIGFLGV